MSKKILGIDVDEIVARGMNAWVDNTMGVILDRTPLDTGALRMSLVAEAATKDNLFVTIRARSSILEPPAAGAKPYSFYVHDGSNSKNWTTPGTGNLFLVIPVIQEYKKLQSKFIPAAIKEVFE